jgi:hypothetical protein
VGSRLDGDKVFQKSTIQPRSQSFSARLGRGQSWAPIHIMTEDEDRRRAIEAEGQCPRCKAPLRLIGVEPAEKPFHELYTFECAGCGHLETRTVRIQ